VSLEAYVIISMLVLVGGFLFWNMNNKSSNNDIKDIAETMMRAQSELAGRIAGLAETQNIYQSRIADKLQDQEVKFVKMIEERLADISRRVGDGLQQNTEKTSEALLKNSEKTIKTMQDLHERLGKIDIAQQKISMLSEQVVSLQDVLSNKQARGAFGEIQLNDLVTSILPPSAYQFQSVLSNSKRCDCLLTLPNPPGSIVIDAKFPLESYHALRNAKDDAEKTIAARGFKADIIKHINDISEKYIIAGETAESALMFLPSEAVYAELHASFADVVEKSYRAKVWIVSPTTLMATLNTIRAVLKDANMREQAGVIQKEVGILLDDIARLDKRVSNLGSHFEQASKDIREITISTDKITKRAEKIEEIQVNDGEHPAEAITNTTKLLENI